ncbi:hypothetical protein UF75_1919 [Desulfosporosinus sp. I2]|nr:hypothetical protein UF75_1919 [Desulfosporosinus sp. I2]
MPSFWDMYFNETIFALFSEFSHINHFFVQLERIDFRTPIY